MNLVAKTFMVSSIVILTALTAAQPGWTCSCAPPPPPAKALAKAAAVFSAKVVKIEDEPAPSTVVRVTLQVARWWKGGDSATITVRTQKNGATCGFGFQPDTQYLIYAHAEKGKKEYSVSLCSRTRTLAQAEQSGDLVELGEGKAAPKK